MHRIARRQLKGGYLCCSCDLLPISCTSTRGYRRNGRRRRRRRPWRARPGACGPLCPAGPRNCGCWSSAALARLQLVGIHGQAHAAARLAPLEPGLLEYPVQPLGLGLTLDRPAAGHDHRADACRQRVAADHGRRGTQVFDPGVGTRADEHPVELDRRDRRAGLQGHVVERAGHGFAIGVAAGLGPDRAPGRSTGATCPGLVPQVTCGETSAASNGSTLSYAAPGSLGNLPPAGHRGVEILGNELPAAKVVERRFVRRDHARCGRRPRCVMLQTVIRSSMLSARMASPVYSMQ